MKTTIIQEEERSGRLRTDTFTDPLLQLLEEEGIPSTRVITLTIMVRCLLLLR